MAGDELTPTETAILVVLMAEAREVLNTDLRDNYGITVESDQRAKLTRLNYISSRKSGRTTALVLEGDGWLRAQKDFDFRTRGTKAHNAALGAVLSNLRDRVMARSGYASFSELFAQSDMRAEPSVPPVDLRPRIRATYAALAAEPRDWVSLRRLRPFFSDVPRPELDVALTELSRESDVNFVPENNQRMLTEADHEASLHLGGQDKHLLAVGV